MGGPALRPDRNSHRCWWFLVLAGLLLYAAGEEVSRGQRLFGWGDVDRASLVLCETYRPLGLDEVALERTAEVRECAQALVVVVVALSFFLARRAG